MITLNRKILIIILAAALGVGFWGGTAFVNFQTGNSGGIKTLINKSAGMPGTVDFSLFWQAWNKLQADYVDTNKLDTQKMVYGAISGMINSIGDPYTVFFPPAESKSFQEEISGSFGGVGIEIGKRNDVLTVIAPLKDTPADKAGIKAGDKILRIDSKPTASLAIEEAVNLIRGKVGTKVTLTVSSNGSDTRDVVLQRETIKVPAVDWKMLDYNGKKVAYLEIYSFSENVDSEFQKAAQEIVQSDAKALIIDLRNNPGGLLDSAVNIAGWLLDNGKVVVTEQFRDGSKNDYRSSGNGALKNYPTVILVNGGSASASEILAGALHDNRGVKLVGEKTFGKGSVQQLDQFDDGSSLKITIAKWLTPAGISISEKGIDADVKVSIPTDAKPGDLEAGTPGKDPQLDKALEVLK